MDIISDHWREDIPKILAAKDRGAAGETARPEGLTLVKIEYL